MGSAEIARGPEHAEHTKQAKHSTADARAAAIAQHNAKVAEPEERKQSAAAFTSTIPDKSLWHTVNGLDTIARNLGETVV
ncbi:hypothetical protein Dda_6674 [Drechslerella dactyloides]|uniref:Uncharacterized protein n=1 Tax=Drechslerella dactyloides TaxID=74499 RepID=A0AAD6IY93_DREDA|nr:hypothetical protein Dda_6674 [Drechslerella dactyloides]